MEKDRSRGIKHIKDKKKYKGNSVKNEKYVPPKSKPNLGTNWDRYDSGEENEYEHKLNSSTDFALLSSVPISTGSHFQFKGDKIEEEDKTSKNDLFCLNLDLLHESILTFPFYERVGIEMKYFEESEINTMNEEAHKYSLSYNSQFLEKSSQNTKKKILMTDDVSQKIQDIINSPADNESDILELTDDCKLDEDNTAIERNQSRTGDESEQDLEEWLDDILDN